MDVIALLFDYVFRDPSIPEALRKLFGRLQVPVVKVGLLDRTFFSDRSHPARKLLDHLADAAVGATGDPRTSTAFERRRRRSIDEVCYDFEIDVAAFAAGRPQARRVHRVASSASTETACRAGRRRPRWPSEEKEEDRSRGARAGPRQAAAASSVPFEVRSSPRRCGPTTSPGCARARARRAAGSRRACKTLDDLLWSIIAKERTAQKARLTKMVPGLVGGPAHRVQGAEPRRGPRPSRSSTSSIRCTWRRSSRRPRRSTAAAAPPARSRPAHGLPPSANVHDFVNDMVLGTWLAFETPEGRVNARLHWVSPMRTRYMFTSRLRSKAFVHSPEELAWELTNGRARAGRRAGAAGRPRGLRGARPHRRATAQGRLTGPVRRRPRRGCGPPAFARYRAASARCSTDSTESPPAASASPMLIVTDGAPSSGCRSITLRIRSHTPCASSSVTSANTIANSSPPKRAARSVRRDACFSTLRDALEHLVAGDVRRAVVHFLEVVAVDQGERAAPAAAAEQRAERAVERAPVADAGERVALDDVGERLRFGAELLDVAARALAVGAQRRHARALLGDVRGDLALELVVALVVDERVGEPVRRARASATPAGGPRAAAASRPAPRRSRTPARATRAPRRARRARGRTPRGSRARSPRTGGRPTRASCRARGRPTAGLPPSRRAR